MRTIGKKIRKQAESLGLTNLRKTVLYGRPKKVKMTFSKTVPDTDRVVREYISQFDQNFVHGRSGGGKNNTYYLLAPQAKFYIEVMDKIRGATRWQVMDGSNHQLQISIFSDNDEHIRGVARAINQLWDDGILAHIVWEKLEKKYKINRDDVIAAWNAVL